MKAEKNDPATARPEVLVFAKLWPPMMDALQRTFRVHDRVHEIDPQVQAFHEVVGASGAGAGGVGGAGFGGHRRTIP